MDIQQMIYFVTSVKYQSIRRAAAFLNVTQPAISRQIHLLEEELGVTLLDRSQRQITLTKQGKVFYEDAIEILDKVDSSIHHLRMNYGNQLHIVVEDIAELSIMTEILKEYHKANPGIVLHMHSASRQEIRTSLSTGQADIAILPYQGVADLEHVSFRDFISGPMMCVIPADHPKANMKKITLQDLAGETLILLDTEHCPVEVNSVQRKVRELCKDSIFTSCGSSTQSEQMVHAGLGFIFKPAFALSDSPLHKAVPFEDDTEISFVIAWRSSDNARHLKDFVRIARTAAQRK